MPDKHSNEETEQLHRMLINFFREEVERRYRMEYLRTIPAIEREGLLEEIDQEAIDAGKDFFQNVLYPSGEERQRRDESVEAVMAILGSRGRLLALLPRMPGFLVKHGGALMTASRAGLEVLAAFRQSTRVEKIAAANLRELCEQRGINPDDTGEIPRELLRRAFAMISRRQSEKMIRHLKNLTELGMRRGTVDATREVLTALRELVESEEEREALDYAIGVLSRLDHLVRSFDRRELQRFVQISEYTERHYLEELAACL
jgi:hypothetical protein